MWGRVVKAFHQVFPKITVEELVDVVDLARDAQAQPVEKECLNRNHVGLVAANASYKSMHAAILSGILSSRMTHMACGPVQVRMCVIRDKIPRVR